MNASILKTRNLEVVFATGERRKYFNFDPELNGRKIVRILAYNYAYVTTTPNGKTLVAAATQKAMFLTLQKDGVNQVDAMPLAVVDPTMNQGEHAYFDMVVDWAKSYLEYPAGLDSGDNGKAVLLTVEYI